MEFELVNYSSQDRATVETLTTLLQDFISKMDFTARHRAKEDFDAQSYFNLRYNEITKYHGRILVAKSLRSANEIEETLGVAFFYVKDNTCDLEIYPEKTGILQELCVHEKCRGMGIGQALLKSAEAYFKAEGCSHMHTLCFTPNHAAHDFYEKFGFTDYCHEMIKAL